MQPTHIPVVLLVIALLASPSPLRAASAAAPPMPDAVATDVLQPARERWAHAAWTAAHDARTLIANGYRRAPALMAVLPALVVLPGVALVALGVRAASRRRRGRTSAAQAVGHGEPAPAWPHQGWLRLEGGDAAALPLAGMLVRLGRHSENDIHLPDSSVHRYHAVIERTADAGFMVTDLSGGGGNGVRINGARLARARLADGDVIEIGRTRLRFATAPADATL